MAVVTGALLDTSVLLAGLIELSRTPDPAQQVLAAVAAGRLSRPLTAWHCCLEFYAVATRLPEEFRLAPADALKLLEEELLARFQILDLPGRQRVPLLQQGAHEGITGGRLYDAHIAETARAAGASLVVTENRRHFSSLLRHGIRVLTAAELVQELGTRQSGRRRMASRVL